MWKYEVVIRVLIFGLPAFDNTKRKPNLIWCICLSLKYYYAWKCYVKTYFKLLISLAPSNSDILLYGIESSYYNRIPFLASVEESGDKLSADPY